MFTANEWARLGALDMFAGQPGLCGTTLELSARHLTPEDLGAVPIAAMSGRTRIPRSSSFALDVSTLTEVQIVETSSGEEVCGASFDDKHPDEWIQLLADAGQVVLLIVPKGLTEYDRWQPLLEDSYVLLLPLAVKAWPEGVGIVPPPTSS